MKFQILSDLHIDSYAHRGRAIGCIPETLADVIIVAGDTANSSTGMPWLQEQASRLGKPIITITGNHEYFGEDIYQFDAQFKQWDNFDAQTQQGVRVLQCESIDIDDVRILGCTLWTDYQYKATENTIAESLRFMRDYQQIYAAGELFSPYISMQIHAKHRQWLIQAIYQAHQDNKKCVVVTHHSVTPLSVSDKYAHLASNAAFVSDLSALMVEDWSPVLWVHGHTHEAFDYQLGNTRVVVNPRAYPSEVSSTGLLFDWSKVVSI